MVCYPRVILPRLLQLLLHSLLLQHCPLLQLLLLAGSLKLLLLLLQRGMRMRRMRTIGLGRTVSLVHVLRQPLVTRRSRNGGRWPSGGLVALRRGHRVVVLTSDDVLDGCGGRRLVVDADARSLAVHDASGVAMIAQNGSHGRIVVLHLTERKRIEINVAQSEIGTLHYLVWPYHSSDISSVDVKAFLYVCKVRKD